jgi:hypothetical protein
MTIDDQGRSPDSEVWVLVAEALAHPERTTSISRRLATLDHDRACRTLVPAVQELLRRPGADSHDYQVMSDLARQAFPPMLTVIRDMALRFPAASEIGIQLRSELVLPRIVPRNPVQPRNRWKELPALADSVNSREGLVRLLEALLDTWVHLASHPQRGPWHEWKWKNLTLDGYLDHLGDPSNWGFLMQPRGQPDPEDLGQLLVQDANWYSVEPCIPDDPLAWHRAAAAYLSACYG